MSIFNEETLEQAVIELLEAEQIPHFNGESIHKEMSEVLLRDDLKQFLLNQYYKDDITQNEIESIIRKLELYPESALYDSNKAIMKLVSDGFPLKREDRNKKDLFVHFIDYQNIDNNDFKFVNQLEILGYEKRIPDGIIYH